MHPNVIDEGSDVTNLGLVAALKDVQTWGRRRYGEVCKRDPEFRLERMLTQYLTKNDEAREHWQQLATKGLHADTYNFWLN